MQILQGIFETPIGKFSSVSEAVTQLAKVEEDIANGKLDADNEYVVDYKHSCNIVINNPDTKHPALPSYPKLKD